jgi:glycerol-3-phosphate dehydrogenase
VTHHRILSKDKALARCPGMSTDTLTGAALYIDGQVELSERLCVELTVAAAADGAVVRTHCRVDEAIVEGGKIGGVRYVDQLTGTRHEVRAPVVLNVAGPWIDRVFTGVDPTRLNGGTKGSHLIVDRFPGAPTDVIYYESQIDQRLVLVIPWLGRVLIGTTDLRYEDDPDDVKADASEMDYLLTETNRLIPGANLAPDDVLYTFSGVRPLPYVPGKAESALPRSHIIHDHKGRADGLLTMVGGKLTTFRSLAEDAVDATYRKLGRKAPPCTTDQVPLPGGRIGDYAKFKAEFVAQSGLPAPTAERLASLYGARAVDVLELAGRSPELRAPIGESTGVIGAELVFAVEHEFAKTLTDVFMRRTMIGLEPGHGLGSMERGVEILGGQLGWDAARRAAEMEAYRRYLGRFAVPGRGTAASVGQPDAAAEAQLQEAGVAP